MFHHLVREHSIEVLHDVGRWNIHSWITNLWCNFFCHFLRFCSHTLRVARTFSLHFFLTWRADTNMYDSRSSQRTCHISSSSCSRTVTSTSHSRLLLPCRAVPDPKARVQRNSARAAKTLATWPIPLTPQINESKESDKVISVDDDTTSINNPNHDNISDFSKITRDSTEQKGVPSMFETPASHVSWWVCSSEWKKSKKAGIGKSLLDREREEREGSVISVAESMSRESRRNSLRIHSFQTHKELYSDERDLREVLERRAQQAVYGQNSAPRKFLLDWVRPGDPELRAKILDYALIESGRELESQRRQWPEVNQWTDQAQRERIHLSSDLEMKNRVHKECYARRCQEIWRIEKTALCRTKLSNST